MQFQIDHTLINHIKSYILESNDLKLTGLLSELHHADVAEILEELDFEQSVYIIKLLDSELTSEIIASTSFMCGLIQNSQS